MPYFVYILLCQDGTFYTGYSKNVDSRIKLHANGRGARYTKAHPPQEVTYIETHTSRSEAMRRERAIKKLSHQQKQELITSQTRKKAITGSNMERV
jgi:putative endonuclease